MLIFSAMTFVRYYINIFFCKLNVFICKIVGKIVHAYDTTSVYIKKLLTFSAMTFVRYLSHNT